MTHPCDDHLAKTLADLRAAEIPSAPNDETPGRWQFTHGVSLYWDPDAQVTPTAQQTPGAALDLTVSVAGTPRWLTLGLAIGSGAFEPGDTLVLVIAFSGCAGAEIGAFLRSHRGNNVGSSEFDAGLTGSPTRTVRTALHTVRSGQPMADGLAHHGLILRLPRQGFRFSLFDMRLAVVPASWGLARDAHSLVQD